MTRDTNSAPGALLHIQDLRISYQQADGPSLAVDGATLSVGPGQFVALVGASGSGKSTVAKSVTGQLPRSAEVTGGRVLFGGRDLLLLRHRQLRLVLGKDIGTVPQDPMVSLNPSQRVGRQVGEVYRVHGLNVDVDEAVRESLILAGVPDPDRRVSQYPHELSGGIRQRVLLAIAMAARPKLLIADELTSALDVTVQKRILDNLQRLNRDLGLAVLFITHDIAVAAERAEHIVVMSGGQVVESGPAGDLVRNPQHHYTSLLMASAPSLTSPRLVVTAQPAAPAGASSTPEPGPEPLLKADGLVKTFQRHRGSEAIAAVDHVSLGIAARETHALVGESGSGKTTVARMILGLEQPTAGEVRFEGRQITGEAGRALREARRGLQMVYQSPYASMDPRLSVEQILSEPLRASGFGSRPERRARVRELLDQVALPGSYATRRPAELSGGEQQRVAIARALAPAPRLLVCDEPVSGLDVFVQEQVLELFVRLQRELDISYLFISHDLAVVRLISDRVTILHRGRAVESGDVRAVFDHPQSSHTRELIASIPNPAVGAR